MRNAEEVKPLRDPCSLYWAVVPPRYNDAARVAVAGWAVEIICCNDDTLNVLFGDCRGRGRVPH